jgi:hypothetical protein
LGVIVVGDVVNVEPGVALVLPVELDGGGFGGTDGEDEGERVDVPDAADGGVGEGVGLAGAEEADEGRGEGGFLVDLAEGCG